MGSKVGGAAPGFEPGTSCMPVRNVTITLRGPPLTAVNIAFFLLAQLSFLGRLFFDNGLDSSLFLVLRIPISARRRDLSDPSAHHQPNHQTTTSTEEEEEEEDRSSGIGRRRRRDTHHRIRGRGEYA